MSQFDASLFASRLRQLRASRGLSLRALAGVSYYAKSYIHELETGRKQPTHQVAQRIDDALDAGGELVAMVDVRPEGVRRRSLVAAAGIAAALPRALLDGGPKLGSSVPRQLLDRTARLRRVDDYLGGIDTYSMYVSELDSTLRLVKECSYSEVTGRALLAVVSEQAQMAGWAAFDAGRHGEADRLYRLSLDAAHDGASAALAANAMAFQAYGATGKKATELALAACEIADKEATPRVRTLLHTRKAWALAVAGDAGETETHLNIGAAALTEQDDRPEPDWVYWVDETEVEIMTGRCWAVLRRPVRAIPALELALGVYDDTHGRDKSLYLLWLADAYIDANEIEQACEAVSRAIKLSVGVGSVRPGSRLQAVLDRLAIEPLLPCVADVMAEATEFIHHRQTCVATPDR